MSGILMKNGYPVSQTVLNYINAHKDWMTVMYLPKKAQYVNPNERKGHIEEQKTAEG
jgi:hypothetical protein